MMIILQGKSALGSIAMGPLQIYHHKENTISQEKIENVEEEIERFHQAQEQTEDNLKDLYQTIQSCHLLQYFWSYYLWRILLAI